MKNFRPLLLTLLLPLLAFTWAHKFYVSVSQVTYSEKDKALQVTSRIFIDDFENVLNQRYGIQPKLATQTEADSADIYIEKYLRTKFDVQIDGKPIPYTFLGKRYDRDIMVCYLEITGLTPGSFSEIAIRNDILTDLFDDQKNIVHLQVNDRKESFVLVRDNNKAVLNL